MHGWHSTAMKQVIVVNDALGMPPGKLAAQVAHASVAALLEAAGDMQRGWLAGGMPKIVLKAGSEQALEDLLARARMAGLAACLIHDAGRTVLAEGAVTCLGLGPAPDENIDALTGDLPLL